ncbi:MAG: chemotaxis protein CheW [Cyanobacteria bacterium]|nr:chemotaxis protein CheW [Cyanobacteriota bacterium]
MIRSFATFNINDERYGLDILFIREINQHLDFTPVPHAPEYIRGLVNLRGQIVTVIDLKNCLGQGTLELTPLVHNMIIKTDAEMNELHIREELPPEDQSISIPEKIGFLVDSIGDVVSIEDDEIGPSPSNTGGIDSKYLSGVIKLENELITLIHLPSILNLCFALTEST